MVNAMTNWPLRGDSKSFRDFLSRSSFGWWDGFWLEEVQGVGNEDIRKKIKTLHWNVDKASRLWSLLGYFEFVRLSASSKMWCRWGYKYTCLCLLWPSHFPLLIAGLLSHSIFRICSTRVRMTPFGQPLCCSVGYGAGLLSPQGFRHFDDGVFYFCLLFPGLWHQFKEERWGQRKIWCAHIQGFFFFFFTRLSSLPGTDFLWNKPHGPEKAASRDLRRESLPLKLVPPAGDRSSLSTLSFSRMLHARLP